MNGHAQRPAAVAIHTRDRHKDYGWFLTLGSPKLFSTAARLHSATLKDLEPRDRPFFALILVEDCGALVVNNLSPTNRIDQPGREISDALYVEFSKEDIQYAVVLARSILMKDPEPLTKALVKYAEQLLESTYIGYKDDLSARADVSGGDIPSLQGIEFETPSDTRSAPTNSVPAKAIAFSSVANREILAKVVNTVCENRQFPAIFICTGNVDESRFLVYKDELSCQRFVGLSLDPAIQHEEPKAFVDLEREFKKKIKRASEEG